MRARPDIPPLPDGESLTLADLRVWVSRADALLDIRGEEAFAAKHLPHCASIPAAELRDRLPELPPHARPVAVVSDDPAQAREIADWLRGRGWRGARSLDEPLTGWPGPWEMGSSHAVLWEPSDLVRRWCGRIPPGPVLDLGCGAGRDAVYLALQGHPVAAVDRLPDALAQARTLARRSGVELLLVQADLRRSPPPLPPGLAEEGEYFAAILMIRFHAEALFDWCRERLAPGGFLLLEAFTPEEVERGRMRRVSRTLDPARAREAFAAWRLLELDTSADDEGHALLRLAACKEDG
jgi:SAM-dependent methyltransferase